MLDRKALLFAIFGNTLSEREIIECIPRVDSVFNTLSLREQDILKMRFALKPLNQTLKEIGEKLGISGVRVRQIEAKAMRKLWHPSRSKPLKGQEYLSSSDIRQKNIIEKKYYAVNIDFLCLSVRSSKVMRDYEIKTLRDLLSKTPKNLLARRNFGRKSLYEIECLLSEHGLTLKKDWRKL